MTAERLLRLLSLFTVRRSWGGDELAQRLGVTPRTIRRDVDRLRDLGYQVRAVPGPYGGYELGAGAGLPPLLLDDDAAVAVAVGLRAELVPAVRAGHGPHLVPQVAQPLDVPPDGARCDAEPLGQLVAAPAAADGEQGQQAKQALGGHELSLPQIRTESVRVSR